jgi:Tol biopolymer transport system component
MSGAGGQGLGPSVQAKRADEVGDRPAHVPRGRWTRRTAAAVLGAFLGIAMGARPAAAQGGYFGRNKVQRRTLRWQVMKTPHFQIYYYPDEAQSVPTVARMAERWYTRLAGILGDPRWTGQVLILYADSADFSESTAVPGLLPVGVGGVTMAMEQRVVMPLAGTLAETDHVLGHELAHAMEFDLTRPAARGLPGATRLPLWFLEGLSEYVSRGANDPQTAMWVRDAVLHKKLPTVAKLGSARYSPYRFGQAFWAYITGQFGDDKIGPLLRAGARTGSGDKALETVFNLKAKEISASWTEATNQDEGRVLAATQAAAPGARRLLAAPDRLLQISPALSPDGRWMIFFSSRDLFAVDLYLANAETGKVVRRITQTATNPNFINTEFINSAGAWDPTGDRFVYARTREGRAELVIYSVKQEATERVMAIPGVGEVLNPSWSPDGRQIAFAGLEGGRSDLYLLDVASGKARRLTNDAYAELEPAWSPDGKEIAFVTDRYTTQLATLAYGHYRLAVINPANGEMRELPGLSGANQINPQWSPDGRSLYFIADAGGIPNLYRLRVGEGNIQALSNVQTGIAGVTPLSPAYSVAARSGAIVYSMYADGGYELWRMESPAAEANTETQAKLAGLHAALLPPRVTDSGPVAAYLADARTGLPPEGAQYASTPYRPGLRLTGVAPVAIGFGVSTFGPSFGGGTALQFRDPLDTRALDVQVAAITSNGTRNFLRGLTGVVSYQDLSHRWQWGLLGGQIPMLTGTYGVASAGTISGQPVVANQFLRYWQLDREALGTLAYPINRSQRVEFAAGYQNIGFALESDTQIYSAITGVPLAQIVQDLPAPPSLNFATGMAALVYDTAIFGGTSPVRGQRYRLQAGASDGSLFFGTLLADYRRYEPLSRSFSLAFRIMHFGRYGSGANDPRLQDYFLGDPMLVRGYDLNSFRLEECGPRYNITGECPVFDRLLGSKIAAASGEARLELFGPLGLVRRIPLPVELAPFYDAGYAWSEPAGGTLQQTPRQAVTSEGATLRINIFGIVIGAVTYAIPNQRPLIGHVWEFDLLPGF